MQAEEAEYTALKKLNKAERHYRIVVYLLTVLVVGILVYLLVSIRNQIDNKVGELSNVAATKTQEIIQDGITRDKETTRYITCIFVIPIEQRTPQKQQECFDQADQPGGLTRDDFSPYVPFSGGTSTQSTALTSSGQPSSTSSGVSSMSSPNSTPPATPQQPDILQKPDNAPSKNFVQRVMESIVNFIGDLF